MVSTDQKVRWYFYLRPVKMGCQLLHCGESSFHHRTLRTLILYIVSQALLLNRTQVYASSRRHITLNWPVRLALRILPIVIFLFHIRSLLQAIRCQTSPEFAFRKYGSPDKLKLLDFAGDGGVLHYLSSILLFWQGEEESCLAVSMLPSGEDPTDFRGSFSRLWPVFQSICFSQFIETLSCAVQGRTVMTETGMSIFEHSLAFAEAEAMVSTQLGISALSQPRATATDKGEGTQKTSDAALLVTKSFFFDRFNTPPEVLLVALISCLNNLSSQILGVFGMQGKFRLLNTGIWGLCFMSSFVWGFSTFSFEAGLDAIILRFPTVCIVGFIPHLLILLGILVCACIYGLALLLCIFSPSPSLPTNQSWRERIHQAQENLQANMQLSQIRLNMHEDFYTALLRIGFAALTAASEAVYLNEGRQIDVARWTWLEEERMIEIEGSRPSKNKNRRMTMEQLNNIPEGGSPLDHDSIGSFRGGQFKSGYARERTTKTLKSGADGAKSTHSADGVGALQRGGRYILVWDFWAGIFWLFTGWIALGLVKFLRVLGITRRPSWVSKFLRSQEVIESKEVPPQKNLNPTIDFWFMHDNGDIKLADNDDVNVEAEIEKRERSAKEGRWSYDDDRRLENTLYQWWYSGGWWGERDESGEYENLEQDDDNTSVISMSTNESKSEWLSDHSDDDEDGRRTPTQLEPYPEGKESDPVMDLSIEPSQLARLLNPQDAEQKQEANILAHHLLSDRVVTRSQYRQHHELDKAHVLTSTRYRPPGFTPSSRSGRLTPFEEGEILEHLIITRRDHHAAIAKPSNGGSNSWKEGAEGLGASGPQCVVCQSAPRTILAWPCRCLSLCEDCRVSLAMNNFGTCVCCRQDVVGFSRLYVP